MSRPSVSPWLVLDLGNGRLKAALFGERGLLGEAAFAHARGPEDLSRWIAARGVAPRAAGLSSVLGSERTADMAGRIAEALHGTLASPLVVHPDPGLHLDVRSPETVGLDRLYAARGALEHGLEQALVVDAGTAVTIDAVLGAAMARPSGAAGEARGSFLGGSISPGPSLVARSLALAAQLEEITPDPLAPALGKDTRGALAAGVAHTVAGAALRLVGRVATEAGFDRAELVLTGGAREFVRPALEEAGWRPRVVPHLVLEGLLAALRDHRPEPELGAPSGGTSGATESE